MDFSAYNVGIYKR